ncbi:MAG: hypothetical protein ACI8X3_002785, partial [Saprospiraceae bacterium]
SYFWGPSKNKSLFKHASIYKYYLINNKNQIVFLSIVYNSP